MTELKITPDDISGFTIFAPNFKPMRGGVAEYTYQLAAGLNQIGCLDRVITTVPQENASRYNFDVFSVRDKSYSKAQPSVVRKIRTRIFSFWAFFLTVLKKSRIHVIITWSQGIESKKFISKCIKYNVSFSVVIHGYDSILLSKHDPALLEKICAHADLLIFNSEATRELFTHRLSFHPKQSYILYPGINPTQLDAASKTSTEVLENRYDIELEGKTVILSVARLVERKGIDVAVRAIAPIVDSSESCRYVIAGVGPEYDALESQVRALGLADKVRLTGEVSDAEKYGLLQTSSLFLMPNHTRGGDDFEGFGISFIEASYFNNAVIGGRSGGAVEAISEGESGFLLDFEQDDSESRLRDLIGRLVSDPKYISQISEQGHHYVINNFKYPDLAYNFVKSITSI
jgi:glycosyltransferase involved in cell wall biosynthesis